jgi:hypothetical protein
MQHPFLSLVLSIAVSLTAAPPCCLADDGEDGFVSMFNGKDLTGWEGKPGGWWVEEGAITSQSSQEKPCKKHHYLFWKGGEPGDFILRFSYKVVGGNSGIQFRSASRPNWDTDGYQADIEAGQQWTGCLFQHRRGGVAMRGERVVIDEAGKKTIEKFADSAELQERIKAEDWNEYEVIARGSKVTLKINGELMAEADDRDAKKACKKGIIAVQMHPGPPMHIQFKNLRIKVLDD